MNTASARFGGVWVEGMVVLGLAGAASAQAAEQGWAVKEARYRVALEVDPSTVPWADAPVGAEVDFGQLLQGAGASDARLNPASIRVVAPAVASEPILHQTTGNLPVEQSGRVWWRHAGTQRGTYHIYFDTAVRANAGYPDKLGLIGIGDTLRHNYGEPGFANAIALHSVYWHIDWDDDGLRDLVGFGFRRFEYGAELVVKQMGNAVYFYKNIGTPAKPLFAPPYRLKESAGAYLTTPLLSQNMFPTDWDGDGRMDFIGPSSAKELMLWKNSGNRDPNGLWILDPARVVMKLDGVGDFRSRARGVLKPPSFGIRGMTRCDYDGDGDQDLIVSYAAWNILRNDVDASKGVIPYGGGLQHFELLENKGDDAAGNPTFADPVTLCDNSDLILHARSSASGCVAHVDWDGDRDFDLLFHDDTNRPLEGARLMLAENDGTRAKPVYIAPRPILVVRDSAQVIDWNNDGLVDVVAGSEFFENVNPLTGGTKTRPVVSHTPGGSRKPQAWSYPKLISRGLAQQVQPEVISYFTISVDWDHDGDLDLVGGYQGYVRLFRNEGNTRDSVFAAPVLIEAAGKPIHMPNDLAVDADPPSHWGPQGPGESLFGWTVPSIGDWDGDGDLDLFVTAQRWQTMYFQNVGSRAKPRFAAGREVRCEGNPHEFSWRSKVGLGDLDNDGKIDLIAPTDRENVFRMYRHAPDQSDKAALELIRGEALVLESGEPVTGWNLTKNNNGDNHSQLVDWDSDGDLDLLNGSVYSVFLYENVGTKAKPRFANRGRIQAGGTDLQTFRHAGAFDAADWTGDGRVDLIMGTECPSDQPEGGVLHFFDRAFLENRLATVRLTGGLEKRPG